MRASLLILPLAFLVACRGEPPPRDYQNNPPAMTHPVTTSSQTPTAHGMPGPKPEPSSGVDGKNITRQPINATAPTTTLKDQPPTTTAATGTHLAAPP
jgi:hypothetical protein